MRYPITHTLPFIASILVAVGLFIASFMRGYRLLCEPRSASFHYAWRECATCAALDGVGVGTGVVGWFVLDGGIGSLPYGAAWAALAAVIVLLVETPCSFLSIVISRCIGQWPYRTLPRFESELPNSLFVPPSFRRRDRSSNNALQPPGARGSE